MFSYIRYFSAIAFVLVLIAAFLVGQWFKQLAGEGLVQVVNTNSASLAQGFINTVWRQNHPTIELYQRFQASGIRRTEWHKYDGFQQMAVGFNDLSKKVFKYFEDIPIVSVSIYMADGTRIIAVDQSKIAPANNPAGAMFGATPERDPAEYAFSKAISGQIPYAVNMNASFNKPDGSATQGTLITTTIPIIVENYAPILAGAQSKPPVEGVIEVKFDITDQWKQLAVFQWITTGGIIGIFSVLIFVLSVTTNKAETIIAKQHEANIELAGQAAAAQSESRDKSQFLANVSHELRTPLNAIIGFSEFIKSERNGPIGNERYAEYIRDINGSGVHLLSLINDILDYSKAEADKLDLDISEVDGTKTVRNSMRLVLPRAEQAEVKLVDEIPREHYILTTDQKKLKQVMLNLLSNAVKFTKPGGSVTVTMWQNVTDESIGVEVKDTGIGIAAKDISRAMAPFGQVDSALSRKYDGTGLGLPLTKKFVEIMGGTFKIESEVGVGTTITFTLPKEAPANRRKPQDASLKEDVKTDEANTTPEQPTDQAA